jgi:hypothetical protein
LPPFAPLFRPRPVSTKKSACAVPLALSGVA